MKDIDEIRRGNLWRIQEEAGGPTEAANLVGMSVSQFSNLRDGAKDSKTGKPRGMRKETARRIELKSGKPVGWLDVDRSGDTPPAYEPLTLAGTFLSLERHLAHADQETCVMVADLLRSFALHPTKREQIFGAIKSMLEATGPPQKKLEPNHRKAAA